MRKSFEDWAKTEIARLYAEADALQRTLDKYLESQTGITADEQTVSPPSMAIPQPAITQPRSKKGSKRNFVLDQIRESIGGRTIEELWRAVQQEFPEMKRSSLRALLYVEAKARNIGRNGSRYVIPKKEEPGAPTPSSAD